MSSVLELSFCIEFVEETSIVLQNGDEDPAMQPVFHNRGEGQREEFRCGKYLLLRE